MLSDKNAKVLVVVKNSVLRTNITKALRECGFQDVNSTPTIPLAIGILEVEDTLPD